MIQPSPCAGGTTILDVAVAACFDQWMLNHPEWFSEHSDIRTPQALADHLRRSVYRNKGKLNNLQFPCVCQETGTGRMPRRHSATCFHYCYVAWHKHVYNRRAH